MHSHPLETYADLNSPVHRLAASIKLIVAIAIVVVLVSFPPVPVLFAALAVVLAGVLIASQLSFWFVLKRMLILEPFVIGVSILTLLQPHGLHVFLIILARTTLCIFTVVVLSATTSFPDIILVLRRWHVPRVMITTLALMFRYLWVLRDETDRMRNARASRTFGRNRLRTWRGNATIIAMLFARSTDRAERIYAAMCSRGWQ